ncbi:MAG: hypothetical protein QGH83_13320 [Candidatus Pacebacteria bacterium]|nr:hypothetical protein [Candidatus Paceibacterota bacterium]
MPKGNKFTKDTIRDYMDHYLNMARKRLIESGNVPPVMVFYSWRNDLLPGMEKERKCWGQKFLSWDGKKRGCREFYPLDFSDDTTKQKSIATAQIRMEMTQVSAYLSISEEDDLITVTGTSPDFCLTLRQSFTRPDFKFGEEIFSDVL